MNKLNVELNPEKMELYDAVSTLVMDGINSFLNAHGDSQESQRQLEGNLFAICSMVASLIVGSVALKDRKKVSKDLLKDLESIITSAENAMFNLK